MAEADQSGNSLYVSKNYGVVMSGMRNNHLDFSIDQIGFQERIPGEFFFVRDRTTVDCRIVLLLLEAEKEGASSRVESYRSGYLRNCAVPVWCTAKFGLKFFLIQASEIKQLK